MYSFVAEVGLFASHVIWRLRHPKIVRAAKESGKSFDELLAEEEAGEDTSNETKASSAAQTPVNEGVQVTDNQTSHTVASSREERDIERGPD